MTNIDLAAQALLPCAWCVTDAAGYVSLHKEQALANNYLSHVRGGIIDPLVKMSHVAALIEAFNTKGPQ